jgi:hypothetical protein
LQQWLASHAGAVADAMVALSRLFHCPGLHPSLHKMRHLCMLQSISA